MSEQPPEQPPIHCPLCFNSMKSNDVYCNDCGQLVHSSNAIKRVDEIDVGVENGIYGVAHLDNFIYLISKLSNRIVSYHDQAPFLPMDPIEIKHMKCPRDLAVSVVWSSLFVCDREKRCIWRVEMPVKRLASMPVKGAPEKLSISSSNQLLILVRASESKGHSASNSCWHLDIYHSLDGSKRDLTRIKLAPTIDNPEHVTMLSSGNFVIPHRFGTRSEYHISEVTPGGEIVRTLSPPVVDTIQMQLPVHLALNKHDTVFVADVINSRILVLDRDLTSARTFLSGSQDSKLVKPHRICFSTQKPMMIVGCFDHILVLQLDFNKS